MNNLLLHVTADDIAIGIPSKPYQCAVALALKRAMPDGGSYYVDQAMLRAGSRRWIATTKLSTFIDRFDGRKPVKPTKFRLARDLGMGG